MKKFRTALLTVIVAFTLAGGTGAVADMDAGKMKGGKSSISKSQTARNGDSWCC